MRIGRRQRAAQDSRRHRRWILLAPVVFTVGAMLALVAFMAATGGPDARWMSEETTPPAAAIVDQLSEVDSNPTFVASAEDSLEQAGYTVDYYAGSEVTVDFYRALPKHGYDLIVLRAHSTRLLEDEHGSEIDEVVLFTSEPYVPQKHPEQGEGGLARARYSDDAEWLFGLRADFVRSSMVGDFAGATIIMMGCDGLASSNDTVRAFMEKKVAGFISWNALVSGTHSDASTLRLLELMVGEDLDPVEAVSRTRNELGPDPFFGANLRVATARR